MANERKDWLAERRKGISATDIAPIMGLSKFKSAIDVYLEKIGEREDTIDPDLAFFGKRLEPVVSDGYERATGAPLVRGRSIARLARFADRAIPFDNGTIIQHPTTPHFISCPDAIAPRLDKNVELKTARFAGEEWGKDGGDDQVPAVYLLQVQWQMLTTGLKLTDIAALFHGCDLRIYTVPANDELQSLMAEAADKFYCQNVLKRIPPDDDGSKRYGEYLASKFKIGTENLVPCTEMIQSAAEELKLAQATIKHWEEDEQKAKNILMAAIAQDKGCVTPIGKIGWIRSAPTMKTDWQAAFNELAIDAPTDLTSQAIQKHTTEQQRAAYLRAWFKKEKE